MNNKNKIVGLAIRTLRKKAGRTLQQSAEKCEHTTSWLADIESGRRSLDFNDARTLCIYYGYTLSDLSELFDSIENNGISDV